jgi:hypothetical protein
MSFLWSTGIFSIMDRGPLAMAALPQCCYEYHRNVNSKNYKENNMITVTTKGYFTNPS